MASDPRITVSEQGDQLYIQTSVAGLVQINPPDRDNDLVEVIYWRRVF